MIKVAMYIYKWQQLVVVYQLNMKKLVIFYFFNWEKNIYLFFPHGKIQKNGNLKQHFKNCIYFSEQ